MAAHGTSYPPGQLHCARAVPRTPGFGAPARMAGVEASRRLPCQPPAQPCPPPLLAGGCSGAAAATDPTKAGSAASSISFWICIRSRSFRYCEEPRAGLVSLLPDLSRGAEDQGWARAAQSARMRGKPSLPTGKLTSRDRPGQGKAGDCAHTRPPDPAPPASGPEAPPTTDTSAEFCRSLTGSRVGVPWGAPEPVVAVPGQQWSRPQGRILPEDGAGLRPGAGASLPVEPPPGLRGPP